MKNGDPSSFKKNLFILEKKPGGHLDNKEKK